MELGGGGIGGEEGRGGEAERNLELGDRWGLRVWGEVRRERRSWRKKRIEVD